MLPLTRCLGSNMKKKYWQPCKLFYLLITICFKSCKCFRVFILFMPPEVLRAVPLEKTLNTKCLKVILKPSRFSQMFLSCDPYLHIPSLQGCRVTPFSGLGKTELTSYSPTECNQIALTHMDHKSTFTISTDNKC